MKLSAIVLSSCSALVLLCAGCAKTEVTMEAPPIEEGVVTAVKDPDALFTSSDPKLNRNKQAAYGIMKDLLEANHWELADKYLTDRYIQHNPLAMSGRDAVVKFFTETRKAQPTPIPAKLEKIKIISVVAEGDYVIVTTPRHYRDASDPNKTYYTTWFDMWRFVDGKADEHWDSQTLMFPPSADAPPPAAPAAAPAADAPATTK